MEYRDKSTEKVSISTTSAQSSAIEQSIGTIRLICTASSHFVIGTNPTATINDAYIPADTEFYLGISSGEKVAIRTVTGSGSAFVTSLTK
tara:strand:- start:1512 stop:1781 length:270 start_codon:yes stop_codon:yes gene_type:complete